MSLPCPKLDLEPAEPDHPCWEEEALRRVAANASAIRAILEAVPGSVFVVQKENSATHVLHANASGRRLIRVGLNVRDALEIGLAGTDPAISVRPFAVPGFGRHLLLIVGHRIESIRPDAELRLTRTMRSWMLTRRQADVLTLVVHGYSNKVIAERLRCAIRTVEVHVSSLLTKAGVESRAGLVARFWTFALDDEDQPAAGSSSLAADEDIATVDPLASAIAPLFG